MTHYQISPARIDELHINNQNAGIQPSPLRFCNGCKKQRSIAQYWNASKNPVFTKCRKCRGAK